MIRVSQARRIAIGADRAWRMISTAELRDLVVGTFVESVRLEGDGGPGTIITVKTKTGVELKERIDGIDHDEREFSYSVVDSGSLSYAYYRSIMRVQPAGDDCIISTRCEFICVNGTEEQVTANWHASNAKKFDLIEEFFRGTQG